MSSKKKLWLSLGPVIASFIIIGILFLNPWKHKFNKKTLYEAATSQSYDVFKGSLMKQQAFKKNYVPFYGSSELSRIDPLHPSIIAQRYHRKYQPFLLGGAGSQSLAQFMGMQSTTKQLKNKKAIVIISPQWFTKEGQNKLAFSLYYAPLEAVDFLLSVKKNTIANRYAAKRLLAMPSIKNKPGVIQNSLKKVAYGKKITDFEKNWLKQEKKVLTNEDLYFSKFSLRNRVDRINKKAKLLPKKYSAKGLSKVATQQGIKHTKTNDFGIHDHFYRNRLEKHDMLAKLKGSQKDFNYVKSPEYADFELMLTQFAKQHTNVMFIIPPINAKWAKYTGLSQKMYQKSVTKIERQLMDQGFENIADFSKDGNRKFFMEDTIHIGWQGWLAVDKVVKSFMAKQNRKVYYSIDNHFFSKKWQNTENLKVFKSSKRRNYYRKVLFKNELKNTDLQGSAFIIKNGKIWLNTGLGNSKNSSYLINSTQKMLTAAMILRQVERGKIKLTDSLSRYFPSLPGAKQIKVSNLLSMTSGLRFAGNSYGTTPYISDAQDLKKNLSETYFVNTNLNHWEYNGLNYVYLSNILEKVTHKSYQENFNNFYIKPLHLKHTVFMWDSVNTLRKAGVVSSYKKHNSQFTVVPRKNVIADARHLLGAGSVAMSTNDLANCYSYILRGNGLSEEMKAQILKNVSPSHYNCGLYTYKNYSAANGAGNGYYTFIRTTKNGHKMIIAAGNKKLSGNFKSLKRQYDHLMNLLLNIK